MAGLATAAAQSQEMPQAQTAPGQIKYEPQVAPATPVDNHYGQAEQYMPSQAEQEYLYKQGQHPYLRGLAGAATGALLGAALGGMGGGSRAPGAILGGITGAGAGLALNAKKNETHTKALNYQLNQIGRNNAAFQDNKAGVAKLVGEEEVNQDLAGRVPALDVNPYHSMADLDRAIKIRQAASKEAHQVVTNDTGINLAKDILDRAGGKPGTSAPASKGDPVRAAAANTQGLDLGTPDKGFTVGIKQQSGGRRETIQEILARNPYANVKPEEYANYAAQAAQIAGEPSRIQEQNSQTNLNAQRVNESKSQENLNNVNAAWTPQEMQAKISNLFSQANLNNRKPGSVFQERQQAIDSLEHHGIIDGDGHRALSTLNATGQHGDISYRLYTPGTKIWKGIPVTKVGDRWVPAAEGVGFKTVTLKTGTDLGAAAAALHGGN